MATMPQPKVDTRVKTEDVTATEGKTFRDFGLSEAVQFVSRQIFQTICLSFFFEIHNNQED